MKTGHLRVESTTKSRANAIWQCSLNLLNLPKQALQIKNPERWLRLAGRYRAL